MKKILFCSVILFFPSFTHAQKGLFKEGKMVLESESDTLKISVVRDFLIMDVAVNKKKYKFILDSGAPTTISTNVVGNFPVRATRKISDAYNNERQVDYKTIPELKIGNAIFNGINAMKFDIPIFEDLKVDGFIGANIMAKGVWDFDVENKRVIIHKKIAKKDFFAFSKIKLEPTGTPLLTLEYVGKNKETVRVEETIWIDFGFNGLFSLSNAVYQVLKEHGLIDKEVVGNGVFAKTAFGAESNLFYQTILNVEAKSFKLENFMADVDYDDASSIGSEILKYYRIAFDIKKKRMYFNPYNKKPTTGFNTFGINIDKNEKHIFVSFLWEKSPAKEKGIKLNDSILSINTIDLKSAAINSEVLQRMKSILKDEETVVLEINRAGNFVELNKTDLFAN